MALEHLKVRIISAEGDGEWVLLTNLAFSVTHQLQSDEIDIIAIGPSGVRVIEVKHWSPQWPRENPDQAGHEAERVTAKARKVGTQLRRVVPELGHVEGTILLTRDPPRAKRPKRKAAPDRGPVVGATVPERIRGVAFYTLREWREAVGFDSKSSTLSESHVSRLTRHLAPKGGVALDGSLRQLAGYVNLELRTHKDDRFHRVYAGIHSTRQDRVMLHLYDLSATDSDSAETRARREFDALHRLQIHDWAPRILDSFQPAPRYAGELWFFTVVDPTAPSIRERSPDSSWGSSERLKFALEAVRALQGMHGSSHEEALIHRNLTPQTILVRHDNKPIFTDFRITRIPSDISIALSEPPPDGWGPEVAPEVRLGGLHSAKCCSDVYSLCVSLTGLFQEGNDETSRAVIEVLRSGLADDMAARCEPPELASGLAALLGESPRRPPVPPARFWTEDQEVEFRGRQYRVVSRLGSGGNGMTFKVVETDDATKEDHGTYVAKVSHDKINGQRTVAAYGRVRSHLGREPGLSAILEVAREWSENEFTALMTWIEGTPLGSFMGVFSLFAEDLGEASGEALAVKWLQDMSNALDVLHRNGWAHGDVSPTNIIVSGRELVLTDYDSVARIGEARTTLATLPYCSISVSSGDVVEASDDIYALAASFFHVLFERTPFEHDGVIAKERGLNWEGIDYEEFPHIRQFLDKATHSDPAQRFRSIDDARDELNTVPTVARSNSEIEAIQSSSTASASNSLGSSSGRSEQHIEYLRSVLQSYPGSPHGNSETRGLDTPFAEQTYVETPLEETLFSDILDRRVRLVVLCGNAGDGKTALLQHLAGALDIENTASSKRILEGRTDDGLSIRMHLDGSASWQGTSADELLDEFLEPFQNGPPNEDIAHLLAINDGRLLEWIVRHETRLTNTLSELLDAGSLDQSAIEIMPTSSDAHIRFISLNQRSLVGGITQTTDVPKIESRFLENLIDKLYGGSDAAAKWEPCQSCSAQEHCEVFRATRLFAPEGVAGCEPPPRRRRARERLFAALQAVHLRGEAHITIRELRAALVYILFGLHECSDYHAIQDRDGIASPQSFADRAFSPTSSRRQGEVLQELVRFDPALESHPKIDRYLMRSQPDDPTQNSEPERHLDLPLGSARRRAYFEWSEDDIESQAPGDPNALDLARGRHLRQFRDLDITDEDTRGKLVANLCQGISRLEGLPPPALDRTNVVPLRIPPRTPTETQFWVEKPLTAFQLESRASSNNNGLEFLHRQVFLLYKYRSGDVEKLRLGADLFHVLLELSDGYQLGDDSTADTFAHLSIFVQRLVREDHRQLYAWNPMSEDTVFQVSADVTDSGFDIRQEIRLTRVEDGPNAS